MAQPKILDLDKLVPPKRIIRLSGKEIDVSVIPSGITLEIAENVEMFQNEDSESMNKIMDMAEKVCQVNDPDITKKWIVDHTNIDQLIAMLEFIMEPLREREEAAAKKPANRQQRRQTNRSK